MAAIAASISGLAASEPDRTEALRIAEALLFASAEPLSADDLARRLPEGTEVEGLLAELAAAYASRGVNLVRVAGKWTFRTASDLSYLLSRDVVEPKRLSRAALETLAIVVYHQPVTRAEIEEIRGVATSKGTLDTLLETGWVRLRARRRAPGRPVTYGTTPLFLDHFGLEAIGDLPGLDELKGAGFLEGRVPAGLSLPIPSDDTTLRDDEEPLDDDLFLPLDPEPDEAGGAPLRRALKQAPEAAKAGAAEPSGRRKPDAAQRQANSSSTKRVRSTRAEG